MFDASVGLSAIAHGSDRGGGGSGSEDGGGGGGGRGMAQSALSAARAEAARIAAREQEFQWRLEAAGGVASVSGTDASSLGALWGDDLVGGGAAGAPRKWEELREDSANAASDGSDAQSTGDGSAGGGGGGGGTMPQLPSLRAQAWRSAAVAAGFREDRPPLPGDGRLLLASILARLGEGAE